MLTPNGILRTITAVGEKLVTKTVGNQTSMQFFDNSGNLLRTSLHKIEKFNFKSAKPRRQIGFIATEPQREMKNAAAREIKTVTTNIFDNIEKKSEASIIDTFFVNGEKVGERYIVREAESYNPMQAMEDLKSGTYKKILRTFHGGELDKESTTILEKGKRLSRTNINHAEIRTIQAKQQELEAEILKCKAKYSERLQKLDEQITELEKDKQVLDLESRIEKVFRRHQYLDEIIEYRSGTKCLHYNYETGKSTPITTAEIQMPIEIIQKELSALKKILIKQEQQYIKLKRKLGISSLESKRKKVIEEKQTIIDGLEAKKGELKRLEEDMKMPILFNGLNISENIDGMIFSL